ncbi:MAG: hypothetical protein J1E83_09220 [Lachnospiraceae bacterium]|nr:hypothetical protein [Lachnospiraceae bacterium]
MKRLCRALVAMVIGISLFAGCGREQAGEISQNQPSAIVGSETDVFTQDDGDYVQRGERITLTLGIVMEDPKLKRAVAAYNAQSENYYVEIVEYNGSVEWQAAKDRFLMDLATGKGADIVGLELMIPDELGYAGVLMDLNTFLTNEERQEKYLGNILECTQTGEALYEISPAFCLELIVGDGSKIGMGNGWTLEEMLDSFEQNGRGATALAKGGALPVAYFTAYSIDDYVNWDTGTADFCNEKFYRLLEFGKSADTGEFIRPTRESVSTGTHLASCEKLVGMADTQYFNWLFGENMVVKGYPSSYGTGVAVEMNYGAIGIYASSQCPEGAWDFVEFYIGATWIEKNSFSGTFGGFPINRQRFEEELENSMQEYTADGSRRILRWGEDGSPNFYANSAEDVEDLRKIIALADRRAFSVNSVIIQIIEEEIGGYYAGALTAEQTAEKIQNRVQLYLDEQK